MEGRGTPFPVGERVAPEDVVDRETFLWELTQRLSRGGHLLLGGPRRIGKTTLAEEVIRRLRAEGRLAFRVDLFGITGGGDAARRLEAAVGSEAADVCRARSDEGAGDAALPAALDLPRRLAEATGRPVVVVLDRVESLAAGRRGSALSHLAAHLRRESGASWLLVGPGTAALRHGPGGGGGLLGLVPSLEVPKIPGQAWQGYLLAKFLTLGYEVSDFALRRLLALTGGHPWSTMVLAASSLTVLRERRFGVLSEEVVSLGHEVALRRVRMLFDEVWEALGAQRALAQAVAGRLAAGCRPYGGGEHPALVGRAVRQLVRSGILEREGWGRYRFVDPLFAAYVRRLTDPGEGL